MSHLATTAWSKGFNHHFHIVDPSPWPLYTAWSIFAFMSASITWFQGYSHSTEVVIYTLFSLVLILGCWWRDIIRESTYEQKHNVFIRRGLLVGMILFILSEVCFFAAFFWAFFHSSLVPAASLGGVWPPIFIETISPWGLPALNTMLLLLSGATVTRSHHAVKLISNYQTYTSMIHLVKVVTWLAVTVSLAVSFLLCQVLEYHYAPFLITDGIYGTTFYLLTGFHGFHVTVGTIFLAVCLWRAARLHFTTTKHVGYKSAIWYWHFVDVVWILLFATLYVWGGR
jgi:heme/copper-type cytochrome/quinol oxidase subunit 3